MEGGASGEGRGREKGRRGKGLNWEPGAGRGARRAYLGCSPLRAFLLQGALEDARLGGKARGPCGASGAGGGNEFGSRGPAAARGTEQKVAGPGETTMKPNSEEEEELVQGVGPWDECFEVAVQLALRAGQVSAVAASSPSELQGTP